MDIDMTNTGITIEAHSTGNRKVLDYIESTFHSILHEIQIRPCGKPTIVLKRITALKPVYDDHVACLNWHVEDREVSYGWPGKNKDEAWRFGKAIHNSYVL